MAKNNKPNDAKNTKAKGGKQKGPEKKPGLFARFRNFIAGLRNELKRVVWPDKKQMKQTFTAVVIVVAIAAATVFIVDSILSAGLRAVGFEDPVQNTGANPTPTPQVTEPADDSDSSEGTVEVTDPDDTDSGS